MYCLFTSTAPTEIYTLSLHDALPICTEAGQRDLADRARQVRGIGQPGEAAVAVQPPGDQPEVAAAGPARDHVRSEEHTSELQSQSNLVCRLLLEKKKKQQRKTTDHRR